MYSKILLTGYHKDNLSTGFSVDPLFNMAFKNPKLSHEEEFRFVSLRKNDGTVSSELEINGVPYINCEFIPEYIQSVTISPTCDKSEKEVRAVISKYKPGADVKKSTLPY